LNELLLVHPLDCFVLEYLEYQDKEMRGSSSPGEERSVNLSRTKTREGQRSRQPTESGGFKKGQEIMAKQWTIRLGG